VNHQEDELIDIADWTDGVLLGLSLWIGLPVVLWVGAVMWERIPPRLAAIHAGDWLLKLLVIAVLVTLWREVRRHGGQRTIMAVLSRLPFGRVRSWGGLAGAPSYDAEERQDRPAT
jgi:hypothetical protein